MKFFLLVFVVKHGYSVPEHKRTEQFGFNTNESKKKENIVLKV